MDTSDNKLNRRGFLHKSAVVAAGSAALSGTALSYSRIAGANDRISLGHIGIGNRGSELEGIVARLKDVKNVEITAVCDLWSHNLERALATNEKRHGKAPRALRHPVRSKNSNALKWREFLPVLGCFANSVPQASAA